MSVIAGGVVAGFFTDPFKIAEWAYPNRPFDRGPGVSVDDAPRRRGQERANRPSQAVAEKG